MFRNLLVEILPIKDVGILDPSGEIFSQEKTAKDKVGGGAGEKNWLVLGEGELCAKKKGKEEITHIGAPEFIARRTCSSWYQGGGRTGLCVGVVLDGMLDVETA